MAIKVRGKIRSLIIAECSPSNFGYLCLTANRANLERAIAEGRRLATEFNSESSIHKIKINVMTGEIMPDDVEAVRAIKSEITDLLEIMADGIKELDVEKVREAANKAKSVSNMLTEDASARVMEAVKAARKAATAINKAGEQAAIVIDRSVLATLAEARTAFLDIEEVAEETEIVPETPRTLDLDTESCPVPEAGVLKAADVSVPELELV